MDYWPPCSPNLLPLDFSIWSMLKSTNEHSWNRSRDAWCLGSPCTTERGSGYLGLESKNGQIKGNIWHFLVDIDKISLIDIWIFSQYFLRNFIYYPLFSQFSTIFGVRGRGVRRPLTNSLVRSTQYCQYWVSWRNLLHQDPTRRDFFLEIILNQPEIHRKMVNTIWFRVDLIWFREKKICV